MHAVPRGALEMLAKVWTLQRVAFVDASSSLFGSRAGRTAVGAPHELSRFDGCFTKLHVLGLTEYDKVLMLDLDLAVMADLSALFELPAPAAMRRGANQIPHGAPLAGRSFFAGEDAYDADHVGWEWGQASGINAGVMLLEPHEGMYQRALKEGAQVRAGLEGSPRCHPLPRR